MMENAYTKNTARMQDSDANDPMLEKELPYVSTTPCRVEHLS
jgi:hypothetical protein